VNDKCNNQLIVWVRAQRSGNLVQRRPDREAKLESLGVSWTRQKDKADVVPHSSTLPRVQKQTARRLEPASKGAEVGNVADARRCIIDPCENTDTILSSKQKSSATTRMQRNLCIHARAKRNMVIKAKLHSFDRGKKKKEPHRSMDHA
jgi:hypothetical protein